MKVQPIQTLFHCDSDQKPDMKPAIKELDQVLDGARIIGVGESAHFVSEFNELRSELVRYLAEAHGFNAIALECSRLQANRLTEWLYSDEDDGNELDIDLLKQFAGPLTCALYGSVLVWLKQYMKSTGADIEILGADLPNTLSPGYDLQQLASAVQEIDPPLFPEIEVLMEILTPVTGESAVISASAWDTLGRTHQDRAFSILTRTRLRLSALAPIKCGLKGDSGLKEAEQTIHGLETILETLRTMSNLFAGNAMEGETSVRDAFIAKNLLNMMDAEPARKIILLAHNNHIQKTPVSFTGELTGVPAGQHLDEIFRDLYRSIALTHLGAEVPEMDFPSPKSPTGFAVVTSPADEIHKSSIEQQFLRAGFDDGDRSLFAVSTGGNQSRNEQLFQRIRSQSASVITDVSKAFDAVFCVKQATKDGNVEL